MKSHLIYNVVALYVAPYRCLTSHRHTVREGLELEIGQNLFSVHLTQNLTETNRSTGQLIFIGEGQYILLNIPLSKSINHVLTQFLLRFTRFIAALDHWGALGC